VAKPSDFQVNQAWIVFQLNKAPIEVEDDEPLNCVALMDAGSCFILRSELIPAHDPEPTEFTARRLLDQGRARAGVYPSQLILPRGRAGTTLPAAAARLGIAVRELPASALRAFIGEAREGFDAFLAGRVDTDASSAGGGGMLNRGALIVRPQQPYLDWAAQLDDSGLVPEVTGEQTVYLVPFYEDDAQAWVDLEVYYLDVFERELDAWHTDEAAWPADRSFPVFKAWFSIEFHSVVDDLCPFPLEDLGG